MARKAGPGGRDDVLAELRRVVDEAVAGRGHLLLLAGEAGIGKTTMLTAAAGFAESRGVRVAWGWGWPGEGAPGYWPWVQVMRILGLDIPWPAEDSGQPVGDAPASERFRLFDEVTSLLLAESRIQPLLLLLDDLQWADQPSQLLLDFLARRLPAGAVAVVGGYRDTEPAPGPVLAALAARTTVLPLTGLGPGAVGDLVADVVGEQRAAEVAAGVHRRTGGNPFYVQQVSWLLRSGQEGIPPGVHEALELRFAALPGAAAAALRTAAVIGQRFSADLVTLVSGQPPGAAAEALAAAVRARVVSRDGTAATASRTTCSASTPTTSCPRPNGPACTGGSAVAVHDRLDAAVWSLRSRYQLATVWLGEPGRQAAAVSALAEVAAAARTLGLAQLAREAEAAAFAAGQVPVTKGVFAREGAMWTLSYGGVTARMRDAKGLSDLAVLLAAPGRQVPAADLIAAAGVGQAGLADLRMGADEVLDATARRQIRARLASLGEDVAEAESWNDPERAARARAERDALLRELTAAAAPGGQPRLLGDQSERARKAVTTRIRDVIGRLEPVHPALASHLRESVTTGTRCSYSPPTPVTWRL